MAKTTKPKGTTPAAKAPSRKKSGSKAGDTLNAKQAAAGPARQPGVERRKNHPLRAKNGHIHVLLTQPVPHVGQPGELVNVRPGFAQLPPSPGPGHFRHAAQPADRRKAPPATQETGRSAPRRPSEPGAQIAQRSFTIEANANEEGHLYGSVNADQIAAALNSEGFPIETESVRIEGPLKDLGLYTIKVHLAQDIDTEVKLWVVPTHTDEAAPSA